MEFIIHCILLFLVETIKLGIVLIGILSFKPKRRFYISMTCSVFILGMLSIHILYRNGINTLYNNTYLYNVITILVIATYLFGVVGKRKLLITFISYATISLIDMLLSGMILMICNIEINRVGKEYTLDLLVNSISIFLFLLLFLVKCKTNKNYANLYVSLKLRYVVIVLIGIVGCGWYIAPIQILGNALNQTSNSTLIAFGMSVSGVVFIMICVGLVIMNDSNNHYRNLSSLNEKLIDQQKKYYQTLIDKESYTKRFRHDINNHIYCMQHLCEQGKYEELLNYLHDMQAHITDLNIDIQTGNDIVNIIVNDIFAKTREDNVTIQWKGLLPENIKITAMDLCTIFSNLLTNAIEAVKNIDCENFRMIEVQIRRLENNILINISNPVKEKITIINNRLITTKDDKEQHGLGSLNVEYCINKYGGAIYYSCINNNFNVELVLSNVII